MSMPGPDGLFQADLTQMAAAERLRMLTAEATGAWPRIVPAAQAAEERPTDPRLRHGLHLEGRVRTADPARGIENPGA